MIRALTPEVLVAQRPRGRVSILVADLKAPNAKAADLNSDGVVDAEDIRAFAKLHGLRLLPEFDRKLCRRRMDKLRARRDKVPHVDE